MYILTCITCVEHVDYTFICHTCNFYTSSTHKTPHMYYRCSTLGYVVLHNRDVIMLYYLNVSRMHHILKDNRTMCSRLIKIC